MNKELEALASLKISYDFLVAQDKRFKDKRIENDLNVIQEYIHKSKQNEKKANALGIIKEIMPIGEEDFFYDDEEDVYYFIGYKVSKEQFDLLKEVLL